MSGKHSGRQAGRGRTDGWLKSEAGGRHACLVWLCRVWENELKEPGGRPRWEGAEQEFQAKQRAFWARLAACW